MPEYTSNAVQSVEVNQNILFTDTPVPCTQGRVIHREGSGIFTLRGNGSLAFPSGGTVAPISVALAINGEAIPTDSAIVTPAAVGDYWHVSITSLVSVPRGCCYSVSFRNTSAAAINVQNAKLVVEKG